MRPAASATLPEAFLPSLTHQSHMPATSAGARRKMHILCNNHNIACPACVSPSLGFVCFSTRASIKFASKYANFWKEVYEVLMSELSHFAMITSPSHIHHEAHYEYKLVEKAKRLKHGEQYGIKATRCALLGWINLCGTPSCSSYTSAGSSGGGCDGQIAAVYVAAHCFETRRRERIRRSSISMNLLRSMCSRYVKMITIINVFVFIQNLCCIMRA